MSDLVWLGNSIVPRWEAFLLIGGTILLSTIVGIGIAAAIISIVKFIIKRL